ncbi:MAG: hypothetical protein PHG21_17080, partial [Azoarcus sp.]|nr:hypothetical protein [Azoarcus sp.]
AGAAVPAAQTAAPADTKAPARRRASTSRKPAPVKPAASAAAAKPAAEKAPAKPRAKPAAAKPKAAKVVAGTSGAAKKSVAGPAVITLPAASAEPKKEKAGKVVRDSFSMPKSEQAALKKLRTALARAGRLATKSEVLRAGLKLLGERSAKELVAVLDSLPVVIKGKGKK